MEYKKFEDIFTSSIFEKSKPDLVKKIATYPERYVGLFRPSRPKAKIIQNLLQSYEIRFGDAFELLIHEYLPEAGFSILDKKFSARDGERLEVDQMFSNYETIFFVEQKIRDDHDSTKKRGQIENFGRKTEAICEKYSGAEIEGFFYFIDDSFTKNKNYYNGEIKKLSGDYKLSLHLSYGREFFFKINNSWIWDEILEYLKKWKRSVPDFPEINFDKDSETSFNEIKELKPVEYKKLLNNPDLDDLLCILFPERKTLSLLADHFMQQYKDSGNMEYKKLHGLCTNTIERLTPNNS